VWDIQLFIERSLGHPALILKKETTGHILNKVAIAE
jgi:hypothetical protein